MEVTVIEAECVSIHCYCGPKELLFETVMHLEETQGPPAGRIVKVVFYLYGIDLKECTLTYDSLKNNFADVFERYSMNLIMVRSRAEVEELLEQMRKMNSREFEVNYLKLQSVSEERITEDILHAYVGKKFKWNAVKTAYFLEKNRIRTVQDLLGYDKYPQWEHKVVGKTRAFKEYCEARLRSEGRLGGGRR
jgi:hypothetical protein